MVAPHATDRCWRPLRQWSQLVGGTERRPTTTARNLGEIRHLLRALAVNESHVLTRKKPHRRVVQGGTPRARVLFPHTVPP